MANSKYDALFRQMGKLRNHDLRFVDRNYIVFRIDGHKFHDYCTQHNFIKPNDKRALDLMVDSAKYLMSSFKGHISLAYGHSDEFSFLVKKRSNLLSRRIVKMTSLFVSMFSNYYNDNWNRYFNDPTQGEITAKTSCASFCAKAMELADSDLVKDYFRWRQIDCHINNLYNTTLHAMTGRYVRHELLPSTPEEGDIKPTVFSNGSSDGKSYELRRTPIQDWITDSSNFMSSRDATKILTGSVSSDKHDTLFLKYKINYNNELEQFKKGTVIVDTQENFDGKNVDPDSIKYFYIDLTKSTKFWDEYSVIFDDI